MRHLGLPPRSAPHTPLPRGIARSGPAILSYGFRPFFLCAGVFAVVAMIAWIGALSGLWDVGGAEGPVAWHAHEMLFGYTAAALGGFVLTAVPNWTGRLPVSGGRLSILVGLWLAGRAASFVPDLAGPAVSAAIDASFLPVLAFVVAREVIAGHNWQNLRLAVGISILGALNVAFHVSVLSGADPSLILRGTVALYVTLIGHVGGRIIPSFTRNYLARRNAARLPAPMTAFDQVALAALLLAGLCWTALPDSWITAIAAAVAAGLNAARLGRWRGLATWREPLLLVLHVAYAFIPFGYVAVALSALGVWSAPSALHLLTVGAIGMTTLAVMTRASRGHTGRALTASPLTSAAYLCLLVAAVLRPAAELAPDLYHPILALSAIAWIAGFALFVLEHAPMLMLSSPASKRGASSTIGLAR